MKNISDRFEDYLKQPSFDAFLLNGTWGKGKTHFYREEIAPLIERTSLVEDDSKKFLPVYISLFGVQTIEGIEMQIVKGVSLKTMRWVQKIFPFIKKRHVKISAGLAILLYRGIVAYKNLQSIADVIEPSATKLARHVVDKNEVVLVFDDLERKSPNLNMQEFIGFLNTLTEAGIKVLLICNEDKIGDPVFKEYKEKVVGQHVDFQSNITVVVKSIIENKYKHSPHFQTVLHQQSFLLVEMVAKSGQNYRHLIYAVYQWYRIYAIIKNEIIDVKHPIAQHCSQHLNDIAKVVLMYSIEFKALRLSTKDRNHIRSFDLDQLLHEQGSNGQRADTLRSRLQATYYQQQDSFLFYASIYDDIMGETRFKATDFINEFTQYYQLDRAEKPKEEKALYAFLDKTVVNLPVEEYVKNVNNIRDYALAGKFSLRDCLFAYYVVTQNGNPANINLDEFANQLITVMNDIPIDLQSDANHFEIGKTLTGNQERIRQHGIQLIRSYHLQESENRRAALLNHFLEHFDNLEKELSNDKIFEMAYHSIPVFMIAPAETLHEKVKQCSNSTLKYLTAKLPNRYSPNGSIQYKQEAAALQKLNNYLCEHVREAHIDVLRKHLLDEFIKSLNDINPIKPI